MLFDFVDEWISVWTSGFEKSLVHLTSGSESLAKPLLLLLTIYQVLLLHIKLWINFDSGLVSAKETDWDFGLLGLRNKF